MILSSIIPKSDYGLVDNKLIISQVYPENPIVIFNDKNNPLFEPPSATNMIYSFCFDSQDGKEKYFMLVLLINFMKNISIIPIKTQLKNIIFQRLFALFLNIIIFLLLNIFVKMYWI